MVPVALRGSAALLLAACSSKASPRYDEGLNDGGFQGFDDDSQAEPVAAPTAPPQPAASPMIQPEAAPMPSEAAPTQPEAAPASPEGDAGAGDAGATVDAGTDAG